MFKRPALIAAASLIAALGSPLAMAQEGVQNDFGNLQFTKTRADVLAELQQARTDGTINAWTSRYMEPVRTHLTRAEVRTATLVAIRNGEYDALNREGSDGTWKARQPAGRVEVLASAQVR